MAKKKKAERVHMGFYGPVELQERLDQMAEKLGQHAQGVKVSRSQLLERCVTHHLQVLEQIYR